METQILITGATGNVGSQVVKSLEDAGHTFRIGAYDVEDARNLLDTEAEIVHFDFLDPATYRSTFTGIKRMFLVRPPALSDVQKDIAPAVWAAVGAGVEHIVFLSIQGVENNPIVPHHKIEQLVLKTGVDYTFLRASFFMQNLSTTHREEIQKQSEIALPVGEAKTSFIDVRDIAAVAARTLTEDGHKNKKYTLTGAEALNYHEVADKLSKVLDRPIHYTKPSTVGFFWERVKSGEKLGYALVVTGLYTITRFGNAKEVTDDVASILDRQPISFDKFAQDYHDCWT